MTNHSTPPEAQQVWQQRMAIGTSGDEDDPKVKNFVALVIVQSLRQTGWLPDICPECVGWEADQRAYTFFCQARFCLFESRMCSGD
jgi:hypothetical protein